MGRHGHNVSMDADVLVNDLYFHLIGVKYYKCFFGFFPFASQPVRRMERFFFTRRYPEIIVCTLENDNLYIY